ncbi:hypothetical protein AVEN_103963-1 [Araneus ventricosus]|uniref:Tesmin/TSO1-like CXC domain-containing protein n=1 Tax=Araneus ventricosus TaxID=182803 RepID=A0A4Y2VSS1_ARAVE|nr:hypothetical protein AVEN_103963-1 [Araneus ventricosus]
MLPYFHASGHFSYAKCAHLYLQDMLDLENTMEAAEYEKFTTQGNFTIRRTFKFWSGTWSDMTIEQSLMKNMKTFGGLTHGRGVSDSILARWTQGMTALQHICDGIEKFCGVDLTSSDQHLKISDSRVHRDNYDCRKMVEWFKQYNPFPENSNLISISTGVVGDSRINCHMAKEEGILGIKRIEGNNFYTVKFRRNDRVQPLALMSNAIKVHDESVSINPTTLFQRISITKQSDEELEDFLTYELCPFPLPLFDEGGMRKGTKSSLYKAFKPCSQNFNAESSVYIIDGGYLLHRVLWNRGSTFSSICDNYVTYVRTKYKSTALVIFDGYPENETIGGTKCAERARRTRKQMSSEVMFDETMIPTVSQEKFLANPKNKDRLISILMNKFSSLNMTCKKADEDADCLIVNSALALALTHLSVVIIGEDIDLFVILIGICTFDNVYFVKPGKGRIAEKMFSPHTALEKAIADNILFLHAMSGCDTTSALFNYGKVKFVQTLKNNPNLLKVIQIFKNPDITPEAVVDAGNRFLVALYGYPVTASDTPSLNNVRYKCYMKSSFNKSSNMASLPPTEAAAHQHSLRVYHQIQHWLGNKKRPEDWGWERTISGLQPVKTLQPPAPDSILRKISCKCKKGCTGNCSCRKSRLFCSVLCLHCWDNCINRKIQVINSDDDDEPILSDQLVEASLSLHVEEDTDDLPKDIEL